MKNIVILSLIILITGVVWFMFSQRKLPTVSNDITEPIQNSAIDNNQEKNKLTDLKKYENSTIGVSFKYPRNWEIENISEDPITHGDVIKDGKIFNSFNISLGSQGVSGGIFISHVFANKNNMIPSEQIKTFTCGNNETGCTFIKNPNGVEYKRIIEKNEGGDDETILIVPTGKYILSISYSGEDQVLKVLDEIMLSLELK